MVGAKSTKKPISAKKSFIECLGQTTIEYINISSIAGLKYVQDKKANFLIKIIWITILVACFIFCNMLVAQVWFRYKSSPTKIIIASNHAPLTALQIPAITICPIMRIDSNRSMAFINNLNLPTNISREILYRVIYQTSGFVENIRYNITDLELLQNIAELNRYDVTYMMASVQQSCEHFLRCRWEEQLLPCADLFKPSLTHYGNCCTFNGNHEYNSSMNFGRKDSLSIVLAPQIDEKKKSFYSEGIKLLIHESGTFASAFSFERLLSHRTETMLRIITVVTECSATVMKLPISDRDCVYGEEKKLKYFDEYREVNCELECLLLQIEEICECLPYYYYRPGENMTVCDFKKIKCLVDNYWIIHGSKQNQSNECECMSNCNDMFYDGISSEMHLDFHNFTIDPLYKGLNESHMIVHITFGKQVYRILRKELMTNVLSLIANLGGIYSLFIGFSALTFIEVIYYFCVRIYINYIVYRRSNTKKQSNKPNAGKQILRTSKKSIKTEIRQ